MEKEFEKVLDKDEKIIKVVKPVKAKLNFVVFASLIFISLFMLIPAVIGVVDGGVFNFTKLFITYVIVLTIVMLVAWMFLSIYYKNLFYAYSNKRIIIRTGIWGVDYKSLDMSMIGAVNVYVSPADKILKKDTGSITFGSTASPIAMDRNLTGYKFSNIQHPYELYREIKDEIDQFKNKNK